MRTLLHYPLTMITGCSLIGCAGLIYLAFHQPVVASSTKAHQGTRQDLNQVTSSATSVYSHRSLLNEPVPVTSKVLLTQMPDQSSNSRATQALLTLESTGCH